MSLDWISIKDFIRISKCMCFENTTLEKILLLQLLHLFSIGSDVILILLLIVEGDDDPSY